MTDILAQVTCPVCSLVMETWPKRSQARPTLQAAQVTQLVAEAERLVTEHMRREHRAREVRP